MERKFEVCYMNGTQEDWEWETINQVDTYTEATQLICSDASIGSGYAIFKNGVRILPNSKEASHELKIDKKEEIQKAMDKIQWFLSKDYGFYLYHLDPEEVAEEEESIAAAWKTLKKYDIAFTKETFDKRQCREDNREKRPVRFIDRPHFKYVDIDELPF